MRMENDATLHISITHPRTHSNPRKQRGPMFQAFRVSVSLPPRAHGLGTVFHEWFMNEHGTGVESTGLGYLIDKIHHDFCAVAVKSEWKQNTYCS